MITTFENVAWWIGLIGSVASIAAAIWAFVEAKKASEAAEEAERFRNEIVNRRRIVESSGVYRETKRILATLSKVGPSSDSIKSKGISGSNLADEVREFVLLLNEHRQDFPESLKTSVNTLIEETKEDIRLLAEATTFASKRTAGTSIYYKILGLVPAIKALADEKRELRSDF
jgi:hypothetical protein